MPRRLQRPGAGDAAIAARRRAPRTARRCARPAIADDLEQTVDYRLAGEMIDAVQGAGVPADRARRRGARGGGACATRSSITSTISVKKRPPVQGLGMGGGADHAGPMKVVSNTAISLDGRINTRERRFAFFGSERDHARMSRLRAEADAVLVGGATFRNWPHPALPDAADRPEALRPAWNVVVSRSLAPAAGRRLLHRAGDPAAVADARGVARRPQALAGRGRGLGRRRRRPAGRLDPRAAGRGAAIERLLVEAGGDLLFQFLAADAIDEMYLTLCPLVVGGDAPSLADGPGFDLAELQPHAPARGRAGRRRGVPALPGDRAEGASR